MLTCHILGHPRIYVALSSLLSIGFVFFGHRIIVECKRVFLFILHWLFSYFSSCSLFCVLLGVYIYDEKLHKSAPEAHAFTDEEAKAIAAL